MSGHDAARPDIYDRSSAEDRTFVTTRPGIYDHKTGHKCPTEPTSTTNLNNQEHGALQARQCSTPSDEDRPPPQKEERGAPKARPRQTPSSIEILSPHDLHERVGVAGAPPPTYLDNDGNKLAPPHRAKQNTTAPKSNRERARAMVPGGAQ